MVLIETQEEHIKVIISLLEKHGRDPKVLDVLCSLCVGNGVAVRSSQNNIADYLLPGRNLLLQTQVVDHVSSIRPNIFVGKVTNSAIYLKWYFELTVDHVEVTTHLMPHLRVGWANTAGLFPLTSCYLVLISANHVLFLFLFFSFHSPVLVVLDSRSVII